MSHYASGYCNITSLDALACALVELGFTPEIHADPQPLIGYEGDERPERAHVIIRRAQVGQSSNDIGFVRADDGTITAIISEYDREHLRYNAAWLGNVTRLSAIHAALIAMKKRGRRAERIKDEATGKEKVRVWA